MLNTVNGRFVVSGTNELLFQRSWPARPGAPSAFVGHSQPTHSGNLVDLCDSFHRAGFNVHSGDLRGHGASVSSRHPPAHLDPRTGWEDLKSDMRHFLQSAFEDTPWQDRLVIAPNISALLVLDLLKDWPDLARQVVLISPPPNQRALWMLARAFVKARMFVGAADQPDDHTLHHLYTFLGAHIPNRQHLADVMSPDRATVERVVDDPKGWPTPTLAYWSNIFRGMQEAWTWRRDARIAAGTRVLLMYGAEDPMMGVGSFVSPMKAWFARRGVEDVTAYRVENARTGLFLEEARLGISRPILTWFGERTLPEAPETEAAPDFHALSSLTLRRMGRDLPDAELRPEELVELCYNAIHDEERWTEMLYRIAFAISQDEVEAGEVERTVASLMPHWDRSYTLSRQIMTSAAMGVVLQNVIERLGIGVALMTTDMRPLHYNGVFVEGLRAAGLAVPSDDPRDVESATAAFLGHGFTERMTTDGEAMVIVHGRPVGFHFRPPALRQTRLLRNGPSGVLIVRAPSQDNSPDGRMALMQLAYNLTQQEARVALLIAAGQSPETVATSTGVSIHTVRTHLKRCYDKLGVAGQTELAARIMGGPIGWLSN